MKKKNLLIVLLTLTLCFSIVFATNATQPTAKDLVLAKAKNFELGYDKGFYDKSEGTTQLKIQKFDGAIKDELGDLTGTKLEMLAQLDSASNSIKINYNTDVKGNKTSGDIFLKDDMVIFTKDFLDVLQSFGINIQPEMIGLTGKVPQYLYIKDQQLSGIWEQMVTYQNQQLPDEYKELLLFLIEAVPDKYFTMNSSTITVQLDQAGFEDVLFNLLTKVQNEKERFADIFVAMNQYNLTTMGVTAEEMREQMITSIANSPMPSKEEIKMIGAFVNVNLTYQASIIPGGLNTFDMSIKVNAPDNSITALFGVKTESKGKSGNIDGKYNITGNVVVVDGPKVDVQILSDYRYVGTKAESDTIINVKAKDTATGKLICDLSAIGGSNSIVKKDIDITVPQLTSDNSLNISQLYTVTPVPMEAEDEGYLNLVINGEPVNADVKSYIKDGKRAVVPVKFVAEGLDCNVEWLEPNEVRITAADGKVISMYINQSNYRVNGEEKQLDVNPFIEEGNRTMVPIRFIVEELGATVDFVGNNVIITN